MDIRKVKKLIELLEESNIGEIEIKEGEESVRISRHGNQPAAPVAYAAPAPVAPAPAHRWLTMRCCRPWWVPFTARPAPKRLRSSR